MSDASQSGTGPGYEFSAQENLTIATSGSRARWWGILMLAYGVLFAVLAVLVYVDEPTLEFSGLITWAIIVVIPMYIGIQFLRAGRSLAAVVSTEGSDVPHLLSGLDSVNSALMAQIVSMSLWIVLLIAALLVGLGHSHDTLDKAYLAVQKSDLKNFAVSQEIYFADSGETIEESTYASDIDDLDFVPSSGVTVTLIFGSADGWSARSAHEELPGIECVIYFGDVLMPTTTSGTTPPQPGEIVCDEG